jgi:subtilisin family serine protease
MPRFIALCKKSNVQTRNLVSLSVEDKRARLVNDQLFPKHDEILTELGFKQITLATSMDEVPMDEQVPNFMPLNHLGAYIVNSPDEQEIKAAQKSFDESDYDIIPDVELSLPKPTCSPEVFYRRRQRSWPVASGIRYAHENGATGKGVLVGVLDTGCDADHIQFRQKQIDFRYVSPSELDNLRDVRAFDVAGHGTHVCGIIAGQHIGVAPGADLVVASVIESETCRTSLARISIALNWMLAQFGHQENRNKPIIINMSLGFILKDLPKNDQGLLTVGIRTLISTLVEDFDVLPVVAIGNDGPGKMRAPGHFPETLSVGAVDFNHEPPDFSGGGHSPTGGEIQPNIAGYGVDIFSSLERDKNNRSSYTYMSGTSMATPYVAGIAALYASADPTLYGNALREHLLDTALPLQASADRVGAGLARFIENGNENT